MQSYGVGVLGFKSKMAPAFRRHKMVTGFISFYFTPENLLATSSHFTTFQNALI